MNTQSQEISEKKRAEEKARLVSFLRKIPLFEDLSSSSLRKIFSICTKVALEPGDVLCSKGDPSNEMFILMFGKLAVQIEQGETVATLEPLTSIGEMGVFTGEPRSAMVLAETKAGLLSLKKGSLDNLIRRDTDFGVKLMTKIIEILAERIKQDNVKLSEINKVAVSDDEQDIADAISRQISDENTAAQSS